MDYRPTDEEILEFARSFDDPFIGLMMHSVTAFGDAALDLVRRLESGL